MKTPQNHKTDMSIPDRPGFEWILEPLKEIRLIGERHKHLKVKCGTAESQPTVFEPGTPLLEVVHRLHTTGILRFRGSLLNDARRWMRFKSMKVEILGKASPSIQLGRALAALLEGNE